MKDRWSGKALTTLPCEFLKTWIVTNKLIQFSTFPSAKDLTTLAHNHSVKFEHRFVTQSLDETHQEYYDARIAKYKDIPTREDNWHDLLNAMIWQQFPQSKTLISQLHASDIAEYGVSPRTPRRDRLTHFDECGVLLLVKESQLTNTKPFFGALATHQWEQVFIEYRRLWHRVVIPCLFGHASAESLLNPFIGLTAKWLLVAVDDKFDSLDNEQKRVHIDERLVFVLNFFEGFNSKEILRPLPLLGIPNWFSEQNKAFYNNTDYFRAQRNEVKLTYQYPPRWPLE